MTEKQPREHKRPLSFEDSFASNSRSKCWDFSRNGSIEPAQIKKLVDAPFWFVCNVCQHFFVSSSQQLARQLSSCLFCCGKRLCGHKECKLCFDHSFASHAKAQYWDVTKNDIAPYEVERRSQAKYWFCCNVCMHSFNVSPDMLNRSHPQWCSYCSGKKLCSNNDCKECFEHSFAPNSRSQY